jgi:peptidoglycan/LPS O-acetylase OafA/YrhL
VHRSDATQLAANSKTVLGSAGAIAAGLIVLFACFRERDQVIVLATAAATVLVASLVLAPGGALGVFAWRPMQWIGRRSYGIYLYHFPLAVAFVEAHHLEGARFVAVVGGCIAASMLLAAVSFRWVETPFLRRKERLNGAPTTEFTVVGTSRKLQPSSE